jgi:DNA-binding response OmpR family regulator
MAAWTSRAEDHRRVHLQAAQEAEPGLRRRNYIETVWGRGYVLRDPEEVEQAAVA